MSPSGANSMALAPDDRLRLAHLASADLQPQRDDRRLSAFLDQAEVRRLALHRIDIDALKLTEPGRLSAAFSV